MLSKQNDHGFHILFLTLFNLPEIFTAFGVFPIKKAVAFRKNNRFFSEKWWALYQILQALMRWEASGSSWSIN